jgi:glycosyltransferase involved in cell wall biosynthesis
LCPLFASGIANQKVRYDKNKTNIKVLPSRKPLSVLDKLHGVLISVCNKNFWKEVIKVFLKSTKKLSSLRYLISFSWTGNCVARYTIRLIRDLIDDYDEIVLYSYWLHQQAYVAAYLKGKLPKVLKAVSRCHRFDVYEYLNYEYIPYRDYLLKRLDDIYCISEDSMRYLNIKYPKYSQKYKIARLGTKSYKLHKYKPNPDLLRVVSCSNCVPVKRIDLIIKTLTIFEDNEISVEWIHYGDGVLFEKLKNEAADNLKKYVHFEFKGYVSNHTILDDYSRNDFDVFVNVSSSEGIPVSIMEAMSFGIPTIATDVGGTSELVKNGINGLLLHADFLVTDLYNAINSIREMPSSEYLNLRIQARSMWEEKFSAKNNYNMFAEQLLE